MDALVMTTLTFPRCEDTFLFALLTPHEAIRKPAQFVKQGSNTLQKLKIRSLVEIGSLPEE